MQVAVASKRRGSIYCAGWPAQEGDAPGAIGGDKRFADPGWTRNPFLLGLAESYLDQSRIALTA